MRTPSTGAAPKRGNGLAEDTQPRTREYMIERGKRLEPKQALELHNGDQALKCTTPVFTCWLGQDGEKVDLTRDNDRVGVVYVRVSTDQQRARRYGQVHATDMDVAGEESAEVAEAAAGKIDFDEEAPAESRDEMRGKVQDGYGEQDQLERGIDYFLDKKQAFLIISDAGLSGGWPWSEPTLIRDLFCRRAERYWRVFHKVFLDDKARFTVEQKAGAREYLHQRVEDIVAGVETLEPEWEARYIRPGRERVRARTKTVKYRPGLTQLVKKLPAIHTVAVADLSRLCRSNDIRVALGRQLGISRTLVVGTFDSLDYLNDAEDSLSDSVMGFIMARIAEARLQEVLSGAIRGIVAMLHAGLPHADLAQWLERDRDKKTGAVRGIKVDEHTARPVLEAIRHFKAGLGYGSIVKAMDADDITHSRGWDARAVKRWLTKPITATDHDALARMQMLAAEGKNHAEIAEVLTGEFASPYVFASQTIRRWIINPNVVGDQVVFGVRWRGVLPPILVDDEGKPDYYTYDKLLEMFEGRQKANKYADKWKHPSEERSLGSTMFRCTCGKVLRHQHLNSKVKRPTNNHYYICSGNAAWKRRHPHHVVTLSEGNAHLFLTAFVRTQPEVLLGTIRASRERDALMEEVQAMGDDIRAKHEQIRLKEDEQEREAEVFVVNSKLDRTDDLIKALINSKLKNDKDKLEDLERRYALRKREMETFVPPDQLATIEDRLARWDEIGDTERNGILKLLAEFRFEEAPDKNPAKVTCWCHWKTREGDVKVEVPLTMVIKGDGKRTIRLPEMSEDWLLANTIEE